MNAATLSPEPITLLKERTLPSARPVRRAMVREADAADIVVRSGVAGDAGAIHDLIAGHLQEGHLLPRRLDEIAAHVARFVVAIDGDAVVACAELAPLSHTVAEVRSLVVDEEARGAGVGRRLVDELVSRATAAGFDRLCAFAHSPGYFVQMGFSIVPHVWLPEKIVTDCHACPQFRKCGQYAVIRPLARAHGTHIPLTSLHG